MKETLEEAAENSFLANKLENSNAVEKAHYIAGFREGAKWQQERSYSEEEVKQRVRDSANKLVMKELKKNFYCGDEVDYDDKCLEQCDRCVDATGVDYGYLPQEAAVINYKKLYEGEPLTQDVPIDAFKQGAKWQQEQIGKSEFLQKLRATLSDAEARRLIFEHYESNIRI